jgi:hypothetical protein
LEAYWRRGYIAPYILDFFTRWKQEAIFTLRPLYPQGKSPWYALDRRLGGAPEPFWTRWRGKKFPAPAGNRNLERAFLNYLRHEKLTVERDTFCLLERLQHRLTPRIISYFLLTPRISGCHIALHHRVQNGYGAHPASYPMGTRVSFPVGKATGAWSWPLTFI